MREKPYLDRARELRRDRARRHLEAALDLVRADETLDPPTRREGAIVLPIRPCSRWRPSEATGAEDADEAYAHSLFLATAAREQRPL